MDNLTIDFVDQQQQQQPQGLSIDFLDQPRQKVASGIGEAWQAGYQGSATGLALRGKLPDVVLDAHHSKWYEKLVASAGQMVSEVPEMIAGAVAGGAAGTAVLPGAGTVVGAGAGAFAIPTAIRESLIQAYEKGDVQGAGDFLNRASIVIGKTGKDAVVGGLTAGVGSVVSKVATGMGASALTTGIASGTAEVGTMTVAPAAMDGRLPERDDFLNAAILMFGLKGATAGASKLMNIYAKTGVRPEEVMADAKADPKIADELNKDIPNIVVTGSGEQWLHGSATPGITELKPSEKGALGPGLYMTADAEGALMWAEVKAKKGGVPTIYKVETGDLNMAPKTLFDEIKQKALDDGASVSEAINTASTALREQGYDGIVTEVGKQAVLFDATKAAVAGSEIPAKYQELARQQKAMDVVPGVKAEEVGNRPFADVPTVKGEPAPTQINYNYIKTTDDVKAAMERLSQVYEAEIQTQRRDTVTWDQTQVEAGKIISDMLGSTEPFKAREPGTAAGAAELLARKQMVVGAAEDMAAKAREYIAKGTEVSAEDTAAFLSSIDRAAMIQAEFLGARAEAGRALNILKETKIAAERMEQIQQVIERFGKDPAELAMMLKEIDNPTGVLRFARETAKATTWEKIVEAWKAGLVSGPITQMANMIGNFSFTALRPVVDATAAGIGAITRNPDRVAMMEPVGLLVGNLQGAKDGFKLAWHALKDDNYNVRKADSKHAIEGTAGYVIRTPFRALAAGDAVFKEITKRGDLYAQATNMATKEGLNPLTREFRERVAELAMNPDEAMVKHADAAAERFTFNAPLGEKGKAVQQLVRKWHLEWAVPFITTPANVFKETTRLTPFAPIVDKWRADWAAGGADRHRAVAELAVGAAAMATTMAYALDGQVSGAGDPDPNKRRAAQAAGWQPYSIKIGDTWYNYQRIQPIGTLIGMAADIAEVWEHLNPDESDKVPKMLSVAFANAVTNTTSLKGFTSIIQALSDPDRYGAKFVQDMASSVVPAISGQTASLIDPFQREVDSIKDAMMNRIPGLREQLMPARDIYGEQIKNKERVAGILPITTTEESTDKVRTEAARLGVGTSKAPKEVQLPAGGDRKLGKVELNAQQRDVFADVGGHMAYEALSYMVNSPSWDALPDMVKVKAYKTAFERGHAMGKATALSPEDRQKEVLRITSEIAKRMGQ